MSFDECAARFSRGDRSRRPHPPRRIGMHTGPVVIADGGDAASRRAMKRNEDVARPRSWAAMTRRRSTSEERRAGYQEAREAFQTAERVRQARERLGVTQAELAARIGSTQPAIARLEAGGAAEPGDA